VALLRAGMAEIQVGGPGDKLQALGLGSCVGLIMYDKFNHIGGMAHIMLPDSKVSRSEILQLGKFADTAVPELLARVVAKGASRSRLVVKMAGGAEMFSFSGKDSPKLAVGQRNAEATREILRAAGLRIDAIDVGGNHGRTLEIDLDTFETTIKIVGQNVKPL
jgi:chemotaxis protein CheD